MKYFVQRFKGRVLKQIKFKIKYFGLKFKVKYQILNFLTYIFQHTVFIMIQSIHSEFHLVSLRSEHLASRADRMSYKLILIFLDVLVQTSRRSAAVKNNAKIS